MSYCATSTVDSITDYNGFSPRCSREVDRYLTFLFKAMILFNYYLFYIYFRVLQAECPLTKVLK